MFEKVKSKEENGRRKKWAFYLSKLQASFLGKLSFNLLRVGMWKKFSKIFFGCKDIGPQRGPCKNVIFLQKTGVCIFLYNSWKIHLFFAVDTTN